VAQAGGGAGLGCGTGLHSASKVARLAEQAEQHVLVAMLGGNVQRRHGVQRGRALDQLGVRLHGVLHRRHVAGSHIREEPPAGRGPGV
jgi:hypothetical protein